MRPFSLLTQRSSFPPKIHVRASKRRRGKTGSVVYRMGTGPEKRLGGARRGRRAVASAGASEASAAVDERGNPERSGWECSGSMEMERCRSKVALAGSGSSGSS
mmetsp:Transcript_11151/g.28163  ORF Transcript_11151/g.28163 Transcript_11151/m.28163 type:complete len:104 (-) Transcript_11151:123-434(-)